MSGMLVCVSHDERHLMRFKVLCTWLERLVGLLGTDSSAEPVALNPCASIHTWFMRYKIDVALLDGGGRVVASYRSVPPRRLISHRRACRVLERPAQTGFWPEANDVLSMQLVEEA